MLLWQRSLWQQYCNFTLMENSSRARSCSLSVKRISPDLVCNCKLLKFSGIKTVMYWFINKSWSFASNFYLLDTSVQNCMCVVPIPYDFGFSKMSQKDVKNSSFFWNGVYLIKLVSFIYSLTILLFNTRHLCFISN